MKKSGRKYLDKIPCDIGYNTKPDGEEKLYCYKHNCYLENIGNDAGPTDMTASTLFYKCKGYEEKIIFNLPVSIAINNQNKGKVF